MKLREFHESLDSYMPKGHCSAQFGDCGIEVYLITKEALKHGYRDFVVVEGMVLIDGEVIPHTWIELRTGEIKDPTFSQFGPGTEVAYSPKGEYREVYSPEQYVESFEEQFGSIL